MAELVNSFSWSASRARLFLTCHRAYFFNHYGMWGGWSAQAPPRTRLAYRLKNMTALPFLGGSLVHETIQQAVELGQRQARGELDVAEVDRRLTTESLQREARARMVTAWRQSRDRAWLRDPKRNCNLFEHYYGLPQEQVDAAALATREKVFRCLAHFREGEAWQRLAAAGPARWLSCEELQQLPVADVPVWVQLDLVLEEDDGLHLIDWKTGHPGDEDAEQLAVYALYATTRWPAWPLAQLTMELHYLDAGEVRRQPVDQEVIAAARARIGRSAAEMRRLLRDPAKNLAVEEDFAQTSDLAVCGRCRFKELCER
ncbi:MAG: PD-(D/E)XK nuclease family protein [Myxococcota bacterium]|jgi:hypothetical protein|nr:PD-(D/E)XK nuclease family protein [Myxococcota bacterium]